jgi:cell division protein FtsI (penicillin-binding protein 3)
VATGELVASEGALDEPYASGSAIKPLTIAAAMEEGVPASTVLDCSDGKLELRGRQVRDWVTHGRLTVTEALARSSNVGIVRLVEGIPPQRVLAWFEKLGVNTAGRVEPDDLAGAATGIALDLSVHELLMAYATMANGGANPSSGVRVIRPETANAVVGMLLDAVNAPGATGGRARVDGVAVAGKTGTTDRAPAVGPPRRAVTFVGLVPADQPQWAIAVAVDGAKADSVGGNVAAPAFAHVVERAGR